MQRIRAHAVECADLPAWSVSDTEAVQCLTVVQQGMQAMTAVMLHLIRRIDSRAIPATLGTPGTAAWLRSQLRISVPAARRLVRLATAVNERHDLDRALAGAVVNAEQATQIVAACDALPAQVGAEVVAKAQAVLLDWADRLDPAQLRVLGSRVLAHVDPDAAEAADRKAVEKQNATPLRGRHTPLLVGVRARTADDPVADRHPLSQRDTQRSLR